MSFFWLYCSVNYRRHLLCSLTGVLRLNLSKSASIDRTGRSSELWGRMTGFVRLIPAENCVGFAKRPHCSASDLCVHLQHGGWGALQPHSGQGRPGLHRTRCVPLKPAHLVVVVSFCLLRGSTVSWLSLQKPRR